MFTRKCMTMGVSILLTAMFFSFPASAHGHHSRGHHSQTGSAYTVNGNQDAGTGCPVNGDGQAAVSCPIHAGGSTDGNCLVCSVEGCAQVGHHLHDNTVYCGYSHEHGYCDGTCVITERGQIPETESQAPESSPSSSLRAQPSYGGHHGCC